MRGKVTKFFALTAMTVALVAAIAVLCAGPLRPALIGTVVAGHLLITATGVVSLRVRLFGPAICRLPPGRKAVALTFDDGPDPECTPAVLDVLKKKGVQATFFCIGAAVRKFPELARRAADEGHLVGNHSYAHSNLTNLFGVGRLREDARRAQAEILSATGRRPLLYRPPVGLSNPRVFRMAGDLGLRIVGWSARGFDTSGAPADRVLKRIMRGLRPGAIILLHDGRQSRERIVELVDLLVDRLRADGYQFARLDEVLPDAGGR